jgi:uncharacterized protein YkwD
MATAQSAADADRVNLAVEDRGSEPDLSRPDDPVGSVPTEDEEPTYEQPSDSDDPTTESPTSSSDTPTTSTPPSSTSTTTQSPTVPSSNPQVTELEQVVTLVNAARAKSGCGPLTVDRDLTKAAQGHSTDMAKRRYFDHTTPEGVGFAERIVEAGYETPGAENIARGQTSATQVMNSWMESDGHRANILNCQLTTIGVGLDKDGWYWTQNFGY